jgi:hypothetical protein
MQMCVHVCPCLMCYVYACVGMLISQCYSTVQVRGRNRLLPALFIIELKMFVTHRTPSTHRAG